MVLVWRFIKNVREEGTAPLDWTGLVLTGVGMAGVVWGFDNLGRGPIPGWVVAAMMGGRRRLPGRSMSGTPRAPPTPSSI